MNVGEAKRHARDWFLAEAERTPGLQGVVMHGSVIDMADQDTMPTTSDIDADFIVESRAELRTLLMDKINKIDGVNNTETSMIMDFIKRDFTWGTGKNL